MHTEPADDVHGAYVPQRCVTSRIESQQLADRSAHEPESSGGGPAPALRASLGFCSPLLLLGPSLARLLALAALAALCTAWGGRVPEARPASRRASRMALSRSSRCFLAATCRRRGPRPARPAGGRSGGRPRSRAPSPPRPALPAASARSCSTASWPGPPGRRRGASDRPILSASIWSTSSLRAALASGNWRSSIWTLARWSRIRRASSTRPAGRIARACSYRDDGVRPVFLPRPAGRHRPAAARRRRAGASPGPAVMIGPDQHGDHQPGEKPKVRMPSPFSRGSRRSPRSPGRAGNVLLECSVFLGPAVLKFAPTAPFGRVHRLAPSISRRWPRPGWPRSSTGTPGCQRVPRKWRSTGKNASTAAPRPQAIRAYSRRVSCSKALFRGITVNWASSCGAEVLLVAVVIGAAQPGGDLAERAGILTRHLAVDERARAGVAHAHDQHVGDRGRHLGHAGRGDRVAVGEQQAAACSWAARAGRSWPPPPGPRTGRSCPAGKAYCRGRSPKMLRTTSRSLVSTTTGLAPL